MSGPEWWLVTRNAIWIVGASIVVAAWSYHRAAAIAGPTPRAEVFTSRSWLAWSGIGGLMFCAGMAFSKQWWETALWVLLAAGSGARAWRALR